MNFREAHLSDIEQMMKVRLAVKENVLSNPALITYQDNEEYLTLRGKGWVCEIENNIVGFAIADLIGNSIWALFVDPKHQAKGIGKQLHHALLDWYFNQTKEPIWLTTESNTRAEQFYKRSGWKETERKEKQPSNSLFPTYTDVKFEISYNDWQYIKQRNN